MDDGTHAVGCSPRHFRGRVWHRLGARLWRRRRARGHLRVRQRLSDRGGPAQSARRHRRARHRAGQEVMRSHLLLLVVFASFVSLVFAVLTKDDLGQQVRFGGLMFAGFIVTAIVLGWLMYPFPL